MFLEYLRRYFGQRGLHQVGSHADRPLSEPVIPKVLPGVGGAVKIGPARIVMLIEIIGREGHI